MSEPPQFDHQLDRVQQQLPHALARGLHWIRQSSRLVRIPIAVLLFVGGFLGFLPVLGFWMIPLGLLLLAQDLPFLRQPIARMLAWAERKLERRAASRPEPD